MGRARGKQGGLGDGWVGRGGVGWGGRVAGVKKWKAFTLIHRLVSRPFLHT